MAFELPDLRYDYNALEPYIDGRTMEIHHGKHHGGYTSKLNAAIDGSGLADKSIEEILSGAGSHGAGEAGLSLAADIGAGKAGIILVENTYGARG